MKLRDLDLSNSGVNAEHEELGIPPIEEAIAHPGEHPLLRAVAWLAAFMIAAALAYLSWRLYYTAEDVSQIDDLIWSTVTSGTFWSAVLVGVIAQTIDGALGMAYGITSTSFLLLSGVTPAVATASVHIAEVFTTGVSGIAHIKMKNVDTRLFVKLLLPGFIGALSGAALVSTIDGKALKPYVSAYLIIMGIYLLTKLVRKHLQTKRPPRHVAKLALLGGFVDAVGGGGWGPVVTTSLISSGQDARTTIGSVNLAEFFLTFASAIAFSVLVEDGPWPVVAGLVVGGVFAAPIAALLTRRFSARTLLLLVGVLISLISSVNLYQALAH